MPENNIPTANPSVVLREEFDDWAILFDPDANITFGLNPMGVFVWKCLNGRRTIGDILNELQEGCIEVPDEAESHLRNFIGDLVKRGLAAYDTP